jgi:thiamine-phosphate pyrophosphorylase
MRYTQTTYPRRVKRAMPGSPNRGPGRASVADTLGICQITRMRHQFTAGAHRAILQAAAWSDRDEPYELNGPAVLLGLLAEQECRAAAVLAQHAVDADAVRRRWPQLRRIEPPTPHRNGPTGPDEPFGDAPPSIPRLSADVEASLAAVDRRLHECPRPLMLATEHLLLGLAAAEHDAARWLREQGIDPDQLEAEILGRYGHRPGPLPLDEEPPGRAAQATPEAPSVAHVAPAAVPESGSPTLLDTGPEARAEIPPQEQVRWLRVIDAAANRGREGLRVVEDYVRFVLDDRHLTALMKQLRHDLTALVSRVATGRRLAARETQDDVGTSVSVASERRRADTGGVLAANFTRLQEALRTLEEFAKIRDPDLASRFEQLRYRSYTLQRAVQITRDSLERLARARLYVLIDGRDSPEQLRSLGRSLVEAGVDVIQLRDKRLDDGQLLQRARLLRETTRRSQTLLIVNDRPDLAVLSQADGVHVGQEDLGVKDARTIVGPDALVGVSTHSIDQARQAVLDGADYLGVGPTFPSGTKQFDRFPGTELLSAVAGEIRLPAFAIGGITLDNLPEVLSAGMRRVAVGGAVTTAHDPGAAAKALLTAAKRAASPFSPEAIHVSRRPD